MPEPLSSVVMTPIQEQQAMQDYVRQRLGIGMMAAPPPQLGMLQLQQQQQAGQMPAQQPGMPQQQLSMPPPVLGAGGPPPTGPGGFAPPGAVQLQGDLGGNQLREVPGQAGNLRATYRKNIPF
jgi:hypothetical protein